MEVPFVDLRAQYAAIGGEVGAAMQAVLDSTAFAGGPFVERFEDEFAAFCGCRFGVGVGSGTEALYLALRGLGIGPGDEVVTAPTTFVATAEAVALCGATPVFAEVEAETGNMDPRSLPAAITSRTRAIIPVHLFGHPADMDPILELARAIGAYVVEDASQAHGALYRGRTAGSMGDAGCFSFYPTKNLGAYGEAGAVVTGDASLAERVRILRDHGQTRKGHHDTVGWNARMDGLQAAVLSVKLRHLDAWNEARRRHAATYDARLAGLPDIRTPTVARYASHSYHIYALRVERRDALLEALRAAGIGCGVHYPVPIHRQPAFQMSETGRASFPVAERFARETLSLPIYPELRPDQLQAVCDVVREFTGSPVEVP